MQRYEQQFFICPKKMLQKRYAYFSAIEFLKTPYRWKAGRPGGQKAWKLWCFQAFQLPSILANLLFLNPDT
jgi:hypothetical protein